MASHAHQPPPDPDALRGGFPSRPLSAPQQVRHCSVRRSKHRKPPSFPPEKNATCDAKEGSSVHLSAPETTRSRSGARLGVAVASANGPHRRGVCKLSSSLPWKPGVLAALNSICWLMEGTPNTLVTADYLCSPEVQGQGCHGPSLNSAPVSSRRGPKAGWGCYG